MTTIRRPAAVIDDWIVASRARLDIGHGVESWEFSCGVLALGRPAKGNASALRPRLELAAEVVSALRQMVAKAPMVRDSFASGIANLYRFWKFLDEIEDAARASGTEFASPRGVLDIPGVTWTLFKDWLAAGSAGAPLTYFWCKRVFDLAAADQAKLGGSSGSGFPLPPNPFPNVQKEAARRPATKDKTISTETAQLVAAALFQKVGDTDKRLKQSREEAASDTSRGGYLRRWLFLAAEYDWCLGHFPKPDVTNLLAELGTPDVDIYRASRAARCGWWLMPTRRELLVAFSLIMLRTGWNESTVMDIDADSFWEKHATNDQVVRLFSRKRRAKGAIQESYCNRNNPAHAYQVLLTVKEWTEPLRTAVKSQAQARRLDIASGRINASDARAQEHSGKLHRLWLYLASNQGSTDACNVARLLEVRYETINAILLEAGIMHDGKPLQLLQEVTRSTWAGFAYEVTGYNMLVTQLALGHGNLQSLLHYINQRSLRNKHRREFFDFQTHVLSELENGRLNPRALRALVENGELTAEERDTIAAGGVRSRQGISCANPYSPDAAIDPDHREGNVCETQSCLRGCSKAFVTFDGLEYIAKRILELRHIKEQMPLLAWTESENPHDLDFLEQVIDRFSEDNVRIAFQRAEVAIVPEAFTLPSKSAMARTRRAENASD